MDIRRIQIFKTVLEQIPEIRYAGDPVLREPASAVSLDDGLEIAKELEIVLLKYREITGWGRGLAAPQIGIGKSLFVTYLENQIEVFINPKITGTSEATNFYKELCMSVGVMSADVERPSWIEMEWTNSNGVSQSDRFDGFRARLYQHEVAHLQGRLNIDEAPPGCIGFVNFDPSKEQLRDHA